jgi:hypothetical protein
MCRPSGLELKARYCPTKLKRDQKWCQSTGFPLGCSYREYYKHLSVPHTVRRQWLFSHQLKVASGCDLRLSMLALIWGSNTYILPSTYTLECRWRIFAVLAENASKNLRKVCIGMATSLRIHVNGKNDADGTSPRLEMSEYLLRQRLHEWSVVQLKNPCNPDICMEPSVSML